MPFLAGNGAAGHHSSRHRLELLRSLLPPEARASLQIVDESNNKIYLAVASL